MVHKLVSIRAGNLDAPVTGEALSFADGGLHVHALTQVTQFRPLCALVSNRMGRAHDQIGSWSSLLAPPETTIYINTRLDIVI